MSEKLVEIFLDFFGNSVAAEIVIFIISMMPILELRGGILAAFALGIDLTTSFVICYIGNILPIPFILILIDKVFIILKKTPLEGLVTKIEEKTLSKKDKIDKFGYLGLFLFVAIPLPGTGAWTGALLAVLLHLEKKKAFLIIMAGVFVAGVIMSILSFGLLGAIF